MSPAKKKKILLPPDRKLPDMDAFPHALWMEPWFDGRDAIIPQNLVLPAWMNQAAKDEIMEQLPLDPERSALWWSKMWEGVPSSAQTDPEFLMVATAMAACMGWPRVVENLLDIGAPVGLLERPEGGWKWLPDTKIKSFVSRRECSVLDLCLWSMRGYTTVAPLHEGRSASLSLLIDRGAQPQDIQWAAAREMLSHGALANIFIDAGLQASKASTKEDLGPPGVMLMDVLFSADIDLANAARGRVLDAFIKNGMPVHIAPDKPSLMQYMGSSVAGLSQIDIALRHPDKEALSEDILKNQVLLSRRAQRMNKENREAFEQKLQEAVLSAATPQVSHSRRKVRL